MKPRPARLPRSLLLGLALALVHCSPPVHPADDVSLSDASDEAAPPIDVDLPPRMPGARMPLTSACDPGDPTRCLLPWPSNRFTVADPETATGLRVAVAPSSIPGTDEVESINRADGFSRVSPIVTAFPGVLDPESIGDGISGAIRLLVAEPGPSFGQSIPLRITLTRGRAAGMNEAILVAYPRVPLAPSTEYLVVVLDQLRATEGTTPAASPSTRATLGLRPATTLEEAQLHAYHAPARALLQQAGLDANHVVRLWDFTTRSVADPTRSLRAMRAAMVGAVADGSATVQVERVTFPGGGDTAAIVEGRLAGLPSFLTAERGLARDAQGLPRAVGSFAAPFRIAVPRGRGDYRVVMFGHGTGGSVSDDSFDGLINAAGAAKIGLEFTGWTDTDVVATFESFKQMLSGTDRSSARLMQSLAAGTAIQHALGTLLGDVLAADTLGGLPNEVAGRRPVLDGAVWAGGSLGGTMGLVYSCAEPGITAGVLNVPGAAWTHFVPLSNLFSAVVLFLRSNYHNDADIALSVAMSQLNWDDIDGANWIDAIPARHLPFLVQMSMGDPVLPNPGSEMVASAVSASHVGTVLSPIGGLERVLEVRDGSGLTQYRVSATAPLEIHGFAGRDTAAGRAARQQIVEFIDSVWNATPRITVPQGCRDNTPEGSCDFSTR